MHHDLLVLLVVCEGRENDGAVLLTCIEPGEVLEDLEAFKVHLSLIPVQIGHLVVVDAAKGALNNGDHKVEADDQHE